MRQAELCWYKQMDLLKHSSGSELWDITVLFTVFFYFLDGCFGVFQSIVFVKPLERTD